MNLKLFTAIDAFVAAGVERIHLLINTPGGSVNDGIAIFNYLRGCNVEVITHNFGMVDSIGGVIFCAGSKRLSVPHARFLVHPVAMTFPEKATVGGQALLERLNSLNIDQENIA
jgi:ATP-dependent Clp protease protease subunit